uniref:NADH-ubiquinone oxidoreductase chain 1 n=1 Tax=Notochthamalus scabrosus TaxID=261896 RepID=U5LW18_NOTSA|nr:NADH dehydrogenase subunit 1 [Notochthamalus scabrosus]AGX31547.1 NADH dehydrogenase subunit 1 [Notochthamalus scabrosus]AGX31560.1 NADH dehydrogenase subunit 1 [Notochthamalus scabrosus]AGX31573.1 NADH dehydrogenase subunit 1 [Notochthamalus scabrosus]AGX31586.1 NADH dehydrogenase subunit 1 [Notochthamalus scabrosus]
MVLLLIYYVLLLVCVLISVAFVTLLERKVLGYIQIRKGPNKVGFSGVLQPFSDAIKLFTKEQTWSSVSNYALYFFSPVFMFFMSLFLWVLIPYGTGFYDFEFGFFFFLCVVSLGVYPLMVAGWSSNSKYALLGGLRAVAQTISYEVSLALVLLSFIVLVGEYSMDDFMEFQSSFYLVFLFYLLSLVWVVSCLAEMNRTPFDFAEGESELVSGFNVEYSAGGFALLFLGEYSMIILMSTVMVMLFMGGSLNFFFFLKVGFFVSLVLWLRGTFPRYRYDKLMSLAWKSILPFTLHCLFMYMGVKVFLEILWRYILT